MGWEAVEDVVEDAVGQAWDGCHKIYVLMDDKTVEQQEAYEYDVFPPDIDQLQEWFDDSCGLRFICSIESVNDGENQNDGFTNLIAQFELDENEEDVVW